MIELVVEADDAGQRLDKLVARHLRISTQEARRLIDRDKVRTSNGKLAKGALLALGTRVRIDAQPVEEGKRRVASSYAPAPEDGALAIVHLDDELVVVDKPAGLATHPLAPEEVGTVANRLVYAHPECAAASTDPRDGGFVHRLDTPTTGVLVAARTRATYEALRAAFTEHRIEKVYWALVEGVLEREVEIDAPLSTQGGRARVGRPGALEAHTTAAPLVTGRSYTLVEARTSTGRLHQIRAHLAHVGHPLVGDALYGGSVAHSAEPQLHAHTVTLPSGVTFTAPFPRARRDLAEHLIGKML